MKSGIYTITNTRNGKIYLGRSNNVFRRLQEHKRILASGNHCNHYLQDAYNLEPLNFTFEVLEFYPVDLIVDMEQYWMNVTQAYNRIYGYCLEQSAYNSNSGRVSEETRDKIRSNQTGRKQSLETIQKRVEKNTGQKRPNQAAKMRERWSNISDKMCWNKMSEEKKQLIREKLKEAWKRKKAKSK